MTDSVEIKPLPGAGVYQLLLPDQVASTLHLKAADGRTLFIIHENKMQLEWLGQRIWEQYHSLRNRFSISKERLKRKKRIAFIILVLAGLVAVFNSAIAAFTNLSVLYIKTFAFLAGIICCLQLLKYFAKGIFYSQADPDSEQMMQELKESILKDYSMEV
jgi:hypothetical protein